MTWFDRFIGDAPVGVIICAINGTVIPILQETEDASIYIYAVSITGGLILTLAYVIAVYAIYRFMTTYLSYIYYYSIPKTMRRTEYLSAEHFAVHVVFGDHRGDTWIVIISTVLIYSFASLTPASSGFNLFADCVVVFVPFIYLLIKTIISAAIRKFSTSHIKSSYRFKQPLKTVNDDGIVY
jgi:hypothetical protein